MTSWICQTCGTQYPESAAPPAACPVCEDERQYVGWAGQGWLTPQELAADHHIRFEDAEGVTTMVLDPGFAIGQRAFLIPAGDGLILWECLSLMTQEALDRIAALGRVTEIAVSHPHFYSAMAAWSEALGNVPIHLHAADRDWVRVPSDNIRFWKGERKALTDSIELVHLPGHFPGSQGLWWRTGPRPGGSLFPGDAVQVVMDRRFTTFMYSYPNAIPLGYVALAGLERRVAPLAFEDLYGFAPGRQIIGGADQRVQASFARYNKALKA